MPTPSFLTPNPDRDTAATAARRRVAAIERLRLIDRLGDPALSSLARLAAHVTGAPFAAVHILDDRYQRRVAAMGVPLGEHPVADSMCLQVVEAEHRIICADASREPLFAYSSFTSGAAPVRFYAAVPLRLADGVVVGTVCAFDTEVHQLLDTQVDLLEDLAAQAQVHVELIQIASALSEAATLDPLTGALNRVMFDDQLAQALARQAARGGEVLVAVIDVDDFKAINDLHGHQRGDDLLRSIVSRLRIASRPEDQIGRLGGDEFGLIAELKDRRAAQDFRDRLTQVLSGAPREQPTITVGFTLTSAGDDVRAAMTRADAAMYQAKRRAAVS